jgi:uncharacterized protein (DUF885 family)
MLRIGSTLGLLLLAAFAAVPAATPHERLDLLGRTVYEAMWQFHPVDATRSGFHDFDGRLGNYTPGRTAAFVARLNSLLAIADQLDTTTLSVDDRIDRELLASNIKMELFWLVRRKLLERNPRFYADECTNGVYYLLLYDFAPLPVRARSVAERLEAIPGFIRTARQNLKDPPRLYCEAGIEGLESGGGFIRQAASDLGRDVPALRERLQQASSAATAAMDSWRTELQALLPRLSPDFALGKTDFDYLLATDKFLDFDSDSLLRFGTRLFRWSDSVMKAQRAAKAQIPPVRERDPGPAPPGFTKRNYFRYQAREIEDMRRWTDSSGYATVPDDIGRLVVMEVPTFLRSIIPGPAMEAAPPLDSIQTGYLYVTPLPDTLDAATRNRLWSETKTHGWRGGVVHEGFPGHYLQLSIAKRNPSFIRRLQYNTPLIEGWALYCEQAVNENNLYPPDGFSDLRWLGGVWFRAARVIVDVKLQTGRMSYDDAVRFMTENCWNDTAYFRKEVARYCLSPGQPMSYAVGKTQLLALRDEYRKQQGDKFTLCDFHDRVLAEGSIPVSLIRRKLIRPQ